MGHTLAEKIIMKHTGDAHLAPGDLVIVEPDFVVVHDIYTESLYKKFKEMGLTRVWNPDKIAIIHDHLMPACLKNDPQNLKVGYDLVRELGIKHFHPTGGIVHRLVPELRYAKPGEIVYVTDSHTPTYGGVGCFSTGIGHTEMAAIWGTGQMWMRVPSAIKIQIEGTLPPYVSGKDIILRVLGDLTASGGTYKSLEFCGSTIENLSISDRLCIANMGVECGGKVALFAADEKTCEYSGVKMEDVAWVRADEDASYEKTLFYQAEELEPVLSCPPLVDNVHPLSEVEGTPINQVFLGSCTNGSFEDLKIAADIIKGHKIAENIKFIVTPATNQVMKEAEKAGLLKIFVDAGGMITPPYCSFCEGRSMALLDDGEVCLGTNNRNFLGRNGSPKAQVYLSSPAIAAASAITGKLTHPDHL